MFNYKNLILVGVWAFVFLPTSFLLAQQLQVELRKMDSLRKGFQTPLDLVDHMGKDLVQKYPDSKDQGQIYYYLAHIHAQSGLREPEKIQEYAKRALEFPLEPSQKMRLYVYWGDAIQVRQPQKIFKTKRKEAAKTYLVGLKQLDKYKLPEKPPELLSVFRYDVKETAPDYAAIKKKHEEALAARLQAEFQVEMIKHRNVLRGQLVYAYSRPPFATEELEGLARQILQDDSAVDKLMGQVRVSVAKAKEKLPKSVLRAAEGKLPIEQPKIPGEKSSFLWVVFGVGLFILAVVLVPYAYKRFRKGPNTAQPK